MPGSPLCDVLAQNNLQRVSLYPCLNISIFSQYTCPIQSVHFPYYLTLVHPKGGQSWVFIGRTDVEAETPNTLAT